VEFLAAYFVTLSLNHPPHLPPSPPLAISVLQKVALCVLSFSIFEVKVKKKKSERSRSAWSSCSLVVLRIYLPPRFVPHILYTKEKKCRSKKKCAYYKFFMQGIFLPVTRQGVVLTDLQSLLDCQSAHGGLKEYFFRKSELAANFPANYQGGLTFLLNKFLKKTFLLSRPENFLTPSGLRPWTVVCR
jgi:hypothetical protein